MAYKTKKTTCALEMPIICQWDMVNLIIIIIMGLWDFMGFGLMRDT